MNTTCCNCQNSGLPIPNSDMCIYPKSRIILDRFSTEWWEVGYGWYSFDGNRKICGWYLTSLDDPDRIKPIQDTDLYDIYMIEL